ncbi:poly-gamma-glutamate synthase PgsB [Calycomorphotria hydatis]|uniref:Capsule biosynthesis protein CapB n=1 Tax=Calycomorphotria hydatis TaxID=2528027 RepID=A0A517T733_9PLAN|nr:poly-gamma-glutamate synthase PgsB [Calycomorphotria hydatis]QDT64169.1 Capsule biosynthesis protein CapB [Calycomorphotria hydatis]
MDGLSLLLGTTGLLTGLGVLESWNHRQNLRQIPVRVHVNGTRGKSSVTRLIAGGLRAGGLVTCAKTTGTLPRMIFPDGKEYPIFRPSRANVIEQLRIVRSAVEAKSDALVLECMALIPHLQWLSEARLVNATHAVITNARADHLDVMGPGEADVAKALLGMVPIRGKLYTAEQRHLDIFRYVCKDRKAELIAVTKEEIDAIQPLDLAGFRYIEHAENLALALRVCQDLGVDRGTALRGMWSAQPDPGTMSVAELDFFGREITFVNGFAANDPESSERLWNMAIERYADRDKRILIFNCRADRPDRSIQLADVVVNWAPADQYLLIGTGTFIFARRAIAKGLSPQQVSFAEDLRVEEIFERVIDLAGRSALVMGMANIGGVGLDLVRYFNNRSVRETVAFGK